MRISLQPYLRSLRPPLWLITPCKAVVHFILPPTCLLCQASVHQPAHYLSRDGFDQAPALCPSCWGALTPLSTNNPNVAYMCEEAAFDGFSAPFLYNDATGKLVQGLKYNDGLRLARFMAHQMAMLMPPQADVIVPVPLYWRRLRKRKYNQSAVLVWHLARQTGIASQLIGLKRVRHTASQVGQPAKVRRRQLAKAFAADKELFQGQKVVLVDDVCTTGSTAHWCAQALKEAGAREIHLLTFAYVEPKLN